MPGPIYVAGFGAVGSSLVRAFLEKDIEVTGVADLDPARIEAARALGLEGDTSLDPRAAARAATVIVALPNAGIAPFAKAAAAVLVASKTQVWLHCSGSLGPEALAPVEAIAAGIGVMHPALAFAPGASRSIPPGAGFAVRGRETARTRAIEIATAIGATPVAVPDEAPALYHAAMVMVSNYVVAILAIARERLEAIGLTRREAEALLLPLTKSAVEGASMLGIDESLSGPIRRGDAAAIAGHLDVLDETPTIGSIYRRVGGAALDVARRLGELDQATLDRIARLLEEP